MSELSNNSAQSTFSTTDIRRIRGSSKSGLAVQDPSLIYSTKGTAFVERKTTLADIEDMILRTGLGDRAAFSALYDATSAKLFGACLRILNNRAEAEDALQDVFVKIWKSAVSFRITSYSPMTWLITIARNQAIDRLRARRAPTRNIDQAHDLADSGPTPEMALVQKSERGQITFCLEKLDQARANAIRGAYLEGETYQDLADRAGVPINTMRTWLRRSLLQLRECLSQ